uniref:F-box domain-containing protein n=1 Tax=Aegilops tauschii TaxID=37682 RepID=M8BF02_AEGTA
MARQQAAQMSSSAATDGLWSRLPADLLGSIYNKIASPLDRVRFKAVSSSWRAAPTAQLPAPSFPWVVLSQYEDGTAERVFCPVDGALFRTQRPTSGWSAFTVAAGSLPCLLLLVVVTR